MIDRWTWGREGAMAPVSDFILIIHDVKYSSCVTAEHAERLARRRINEIFIGGRLTLPHP